MWWSVVAEDCVVGCGNGGLYGEAVVVWWVCGNLGLCGGAVVAEVSSGCREV